MARRWLDESFLGRSLWHIVPRDHQQSDSSLRRRQITTVVVVIVGAIVLGISIRIEPGSPWFYPSSVALAAVWAVGAFASGPLHLGRIASITGDDHRRPVIQPILLGLAMAGVFVAGALIVRQIEPLAAQVGNVLKFATEGSLPILAVITILNGIAEELFFRGAAYAAITRRPVLWTTVAYTVATAATGNIMLSFAAALLGVVVGLQRRASGGILAPILTHCTWSMAMLLLLPVIFGLR
ncbi:MAG: type II CAAX endopeptidase family protein [Aeromicrobium sp.]|uniref:CPBP family intramembrane glutamic endopeptidase n=1 Tax=Aeromicrobium sp. TaxID=1871063 RepID=UPI003C3ECA2B